MIYSIHFIQDINPELPFWCVKDQSGTEVAWHTTQEEAIEWINNNG